MCIYIYTCICTLCTQSTITSTALLHIHCVLWSFELTRAGGGVMVVTLHPFTSSVEEHPPPAEVRVGVRVGGRVETRFVLHPRTLLLRAVLQGEQFSRNAHYWTIVTPAMVTDVSVHPGSTGGQRTHSGGLISADGAAASTLSRGPLYSAVVFSSSPAHSTWSC